MAEENDYSALFMIRRPFNDLQPVIGCDVVQFRFLGISLAGYNALISATIVVLLLGAIIFQARRKSA